MKIALILAAILILNALATVVLGCTPVDPGYPQFCA